MSTMKAIKEIITTTSSELVLNLPEELVNKTVEIIILPFDEEKDKTGGKKNRLLKIFNESGGVLPADYKFNREESHER